MALSHAFARKSDDPFDSCLFDPLAFSSLMFIPGHPATFARDAVAAANTQVDWKETCDAHIFKANLPGVAKEDVKVQVEDGCILQICGERKKEEVTASDRFHRVERVLGSFLRRFRLPHNAKVEEVKATLENGVLTVTVPKKKAATDPKACIQPIDITCH